MNYGVSKVVIDERTGSVAEMISDTRESSVPCVRSRAPAIRRAATDGGMKARPASSPSERDTAAGPFVASARLASRSSNDSVTSPLHRHEFKLDAQMRCIPSRRHIQHPNLTSPNHLLARPQIHDVTNHLPLSPTQLGDVQAVSQERTGSDSSTIPACNTAPQRAVCSVRRGRPDLVDPEFGVVVAHRVADVAVGWLGGSLR